MRCASPLSRFFLSILIIVAPLWVTQQTKGHRTKFRSAFLDMAQPAESEHSGTVKQQTQDKECAFRAFIIVDGFAKDVERPAKTLWEQEQVHISIDLLQTVFPNAYMGLSRGSSLHRSCIVPLSPISDLPLPDLPRENVFMLPRAMQSNPYRVLSSAAEEILRSERDEVGAFPAFVIIITNVPMLGQTDIDWTQISYDEEKKAADQLLNTPDLECAAKEGSLGKQEAAARLKTANVLRVIVVVPEGLQSGYQKEFLKFPGPVVVFGYERPSDIGLLITQAIKNTGVCQRAANRPAIDSAVTGPTNQLAVTADSSKAKKQRLLLKYLPHGVATGALGLGTYWLAQRALGAGPSASVPKPGAIQNQETKSDLYSEALNVVPWFCIRLFLAFKLMQELS